MDKHTFREKVIVITGASAGIGRESALQLAKQKSFLVLAARDKKRIEETAVACIKLGAKAIAVQTDIAEKEQCRSLKIKPYRSSDVSTA